MFFFANCKKQNRIILLRVRGKNEDEGEAEGGNEDEGEGEDEGARC